MDSFYTIVVVVAIAILIMALIGIGIMLQAQNESVAFPLYATQCPDGWAVDGSGCKLPDFKSPNHPNYPTKTGKDTDLAIITDLSNSVVYSGPEKLYITDVNARKMTFNPVATTCQKRLWTNDYSVTWDGVSNYNKCV